MKGGINIYNKYFKRLLDILISSIGLILAMPLILIISICILLFIGRPIFFIQKRVGKDGNVFNMIKFRTMTNEKDKYGNLLNDSKRITKLGNFLRSASLDELPELINVLKGEMSLVGPRPLLVEYLDLYSPEEFRRHEVLPGITGLAQVKGRNLLEWEEKFKLDVEYVDSVSLKKDIYIVILTIYTIIKREGITDGKTSSMTKFKGSYSKMCK